jgi:hypothetical protein
MALETTLVYSDGVPIPFTCAEADDMTKGSILLLTDPMTAAVTTGDTDEIAGILALDKVGGDGVTKCAVHRKGIFRGYAGAAGVTAGEAIITDTATGAANELVDADVNSEQIVGIALETATDGETFLFELKPMAVDLA